MFNLENLTGDLQKELAENEEITQENSKKNEEKKQKKKVKKAENTAFSLEKQENNISEKNEEKNSQENEEKNGEKNSDNTVDDDEDGENGNHSDGNVIIEDDQDDDDSDDDFEDDDGLDGNDLDGEDDDDDDFDDGEIPEGDDPLKGFAQDPNKEQKVKVEEVIPPTSPKNLKNIEKLGRVALARVDVMKAKACANLSGQHMAEYLADEEMMDALLDAIKEYISSMEYKAPTPFGTLIITVLLWGVPSFGLALWHKYSMPKPQTPAQETTSTNFNQSAPEKTDYSHLKEFQEGRKVFKVNKTKGTYSATAQNTFIALEHANEFPSPIIQKWIDEGLTNKEIRAKLYGE